MCFGKSGNMNNEPGFRGGEDEPLDAAELAEMEEYADSFLEDSPDLPAQEFSALNRQLDQLQSALDMIESRNSNIHQELLELLRSNREVRRGIAEEGDEDAAAIESQTTPANPTSASDAQCETTDAAAKSSEASENSTSSDNVASAEASVVQSLEAVKLDKSS